MKYKLYLLDISEWLQKVNKEKSGLMLEADSAGQALACISKERVEKVLRARTPLGQAHSLGAGLLLQYIWNMYENAKEGSAGSAYTPGDENGSVISEGCERQLQGKLQQVTIQQLLDSLQDLPAETIPMTYGPKGKPHFADKQVYFSLSHSGDYVLCAVSREEIGADIQQCKPGVRESLVRRVLNEAELVQWQDLQQDESFFYRKWTEKEAYGKLTGSGVFEVILEESTPLVTTCMDTLWLVPGYCISVCQCLK